MTAPDVFADENLARARARATEHELTELRSRLLRSLSIGPPCEEDGLAVNELAAALDRDPDELLAELIEEALDPPPSSGPTAH